jgi:hypothetical protein
VDFSLVNGTLQDGTWQTTVTVPQFSEDGVWRVDFLQIRDNANNSSFLSEVDLGALGLQADLSVTSNPSDVSHPELGKLSFVPAVINTSNGHQFVTVTLEITDDLAGADFSPTTPTLSFFEAGVNFRSPSAQQSHSVFNDFQLISGTPQNGTWQGSAFFPQFSEEGTWRIDFAQLKDVTGNTVSFDNNTLQASGFPTSLVVVRPSLIGDGRIDDPASGGTVMDEVFGARAQIIFPPSVLSAPTDVSIDVFSEPLDVPTPIGFQGPGTHFVNIELTPEPAFPLPAPGLMVVLPLPNPLLPGRQLSLFRVDPTSGNLVPSLDTVGAPVIGIVDPGGLSASFAGIAHLSIVVGLLPAIPGDVNGDDTVDCGDLVIIKASFGKRSGQPGFDPRADINGDGVVNVKDLAFVARKIPVGVRCQ